MKQFLPRRHRSERSNRRCFRWDLVRFAGWANRDERLALEFVGYSLTCHPGIHIPRSLRKYATSEARMEYLRICDEKNRRFFERLEKCPW